MSLWLHGLGARVTGFALAPATLPNLWSIAGACSRSIIGDVRDTAAVRAALAAADPEIVIHMAAQALVRESYRDPLETYSTNVMGTGVLLEACRTLRRLKCVVVVTSDKVYENDGMGRAFAESDRLGGHDPYSNSKACAELLTASFRESFFHDGPPIATARAGNVIGGGDWSADRLIPDCVRALTRGAPVRLRYPGATRPWQHVLEPIGGYLRLAEALVQAPGRTPRAVNFGPDAHSVCTVREVVEAFSTRFGGKPGWIPDSGEHPPEARALTLSSALAAGALAWHPKLDVAQSVSWTADWYRAHRAGENMLWYSQEQLREYRNLLGRSS
jgi:CDP-glucose 4,6-dehydratase